MVKSVTNKVLSDRVTRERTYQVIQGRTDRKDAMCQLIVTVDQLLSEGFTGCIEIHCNQGGICSVKAKETQYIPDRH